MAPMERRLVVQGSGIGTGTGTARNKVCEISAKWPELPVTGGWIVAVPEIISAEVGIL